MLLPHLGVYIELHGTLVCEMMESEPVVSFGEEKKKKIYIYSSIIHCNKTVSEAVVRL